MSIDSERSTELSAKTGSILDGVSLSAASSAAIDRQAALEQARDWISRSAQTSFRQAWNR